MQLHLAPPAVLVALLASTSAGATSTAHTTADVTPAREIMHAPATDVLPPTVPCPAYLGPQCDSRAHERWVTGQDIVDHTNPPLAA
jgi:Spy/CpxP family protein refolding chaperone